MLNELEDEYDWHTVEIKHDYPDCYNRDSITRIQKGVKKVNHHKLYSPEDKDELLNDLMRYGTAIARIDPTSVRLKYIDKKESKLMYEFKISSSLAIDFFEIANDLTRENPIAKVQFKSVNGLTHYYVVVHESLIKKAEVLGIISPDGFNPLWAELEHPSEYSLWKQWAKDVRDAQWDSERGVVTVQSLEI